MTAHAYALLDSYVYGFALQEAALPFKGPDTAADVTESMMQQFPADAYPPRRDGNRVHPAPGYDFGDEFEFGLNVILDALASIAHDHSNPASSSGPAVLRQVPR